MLGALEEDFGQGRAAASATCCGAVQLVQESLQRPDRLVEEFQTVLEPAHASGQLLRPTRRGSR